MGIAWLAQDLAGGWFGARGSDEAVLRAARGMFGGVGEAAGGGSVAASEPAWWGWPQVSLMSGRTVLAVEEVAASERGS